MSDVLKVLIKKCKTNVKYPNVQNIHKEALTSLEIECSTNYRKRQCLMLLNKKNHYAKYAKQNVKGPNVQNIQKEELTTLLID